MSHPGVGTGNGTTPTGPTGTGRTDILEAPVATSTASSPSASSSTTRAEERDRPTGGPVFSSLLGLCAVAVLLQGLWAGIFLRFDGKRDESASWIDVHARGGEVALVLAVLATAWALWKLRSRVDLWLGSIVLVVLLAAESYIGGLIRDQGKDVMTAVHVPLALAIMGLVVWLPTRAARRR